MRLKVHKTNTLMLHTMQLNSSRIRLVAYPFSETVTDKDADARVVGILAKLCQKNAEISKALIDFLGYYGLEKNDSRYENRLSAHPWLLENGFCYFHIGINVKVLENLNFCTPHFYFWKEVVITQPNMIFRCFFQRYTMGEKYSL